MYWVTTRSFHTKHKHRREYIQEREPTTEYYTFTIKKRTVKLPVSLQGVRAVVYNSLIYNFLDSLIMYQVDSAP